jgi:hypothetical protein
MATHRENTDKALRPHRLSPYPSEGWKFPEVQEDFEEGVSGDNEEI